MNSSVQASSHLVAKDQLRSYIERIERVQTEIAELQADVRDILAEAAGSGFDKKAIRAILKLRKQDAAERKEHEAILHTYMHALGMDDDVSDATRPARRDSEPASPAPPRADAGSDANDEAHIRAQAQRAARSPKVRSAIKKLGTPVELTDEERAKGYSAAFVGKDGTRMAIGLTASTGPPAQPP